MRGRLAGEEADQAGGAVRVRRGLRGGLGEPAGDAAPDHGDGGGEDGGGDPVLALHQCDERDPLGELGVFVEETEERVYGFTLSGMGEEITLGPCLFFSACFFIHWRCSTTISDQHE